jgi:hypothetical protein
MTSSPDPVGDQLADISITQIDLAVVEQFESEGDYVGVALDLLIEAGSYTCVAANLYKNEEMYWTRDEAILGGHLVRLFKLIDALLDQTCKHRRETSMVIARLIFECIVNLRYMITNASDDLFRSYRAYSLQHELRLLERIEANISERDDLSLPIEDRMIRSILSSFKASDLTRKEVAENQKRNWSGKNLYERAKSIGLEQAYLAAFGGGSHTIHGNWQDLLEYHLEKIDDNAYRSNIGWHAPRPQILEALVTLTADALADYIQFIAGSDASDFLKRLQDLSDRTYQLSELHENFLVKSKRDA